MNGRLLSRSCEVVEEEEEVEEADDDDDDSLFVTPFVPAPPEDVNGDCFDEETFVLFLIGVVIGGCGGLCWHLQGDVDTNRKGCCWSFCDVGTCRLLHNKSRPTLHVNN